jgi:hypothetical protein
MKAIAVRQPPTVTRSRVKPTGELATPEEKPAIAGQMQAAADLGHHLDALPIGAPGDRYEREADRAAAQVVRGLESGRGPSIPVQATPTPGPAVQAKGEGGASSGSADALTQLPPAPGSGRPLEAAVRGPMERAFGANLGDVRLHTSGPAEQLNESLKARATTIGHDIYFDKGEYDLGSTSGRQLLAHELTHVLQQRRGGRRLQRGARQDEREMRAVEGQALMAPVEDFLGARAHNQGADIHVAAGQALPVAHEAGHVVQQAPAPAAPAAGLQLNDDDQDR